MTPPANPTNPAANAPSSGSDAWTAVPFNEWQDTYATLHMWTQIVGKIRLGQTPWTHHSRHVTLYVTSRGLTTSPIPFGERSCQIDFDFIDHQLLIRASDGGLATMALRARTVANFYAELMGKLAGLGFSVRIHTTPNELVDGIPFEKDLTHASYDAPSVHRFRRACAGGPGVQDFSQPLHRQVQSGAFFLGQLRPVGDTLFRTPRARASRRRAALP